MRILPLLLATALAVAPPAQAKQFEIFDGQFYNGKYYPLVDMIEWGEQQGELPHMEFHVHMKDKPIEIAAVPGEKNGKPVLWLMFDLKFRGERICRHVLAPRHFKPEMPLFAYVDRSDADYENIYVSSEPRNDKKLQPYAMPAYERCQDENASNMPLGQGPGERMPASIPTDAASPAATLPAGASPPVAPVKGDGKNIGVDYDNHAVPFSF